jgi:hypothetical protein
MYLKLNAGGAVMDGIPEVLMCEDVLSVNLITLIETGKIKELPLTQGKVALVDDEDYEWLSHWKCYANKRGYTYYALRSAWKDKYPHPIFMHREILGLVKNDGKIADHRNRNGLHNWKENLRIVTPAISILNRKENKNNTSGYRGVSWNKNAKKWIVNVGINKENKYCGLYLDPVIAAHIYDLEAIKYFGNNAILNFPETGA